jgi:hypothetical protein
LILAIGIPLLFIGVEQAAEGLRCMAENEFDADAIQSWQRVAFFAALLIFSLHVWYFSRVLLYFHFHDSPPLTPGIRRLRSILPRIAGILPCIIIAFALWKATAVYDLIRAPAPPSHFRGPRVAQQQLQQNQPTQQRRAGPRPPRLNARPQDVGRSALKYMAAVSLVMAVALYFFFFERHKWLSKRNSHYLDPKTETAFDLKKATKYAVLAMTCFSLALFVIFTVRPVGPAQFLGTGSILLLAGAAWISAGSWLVYLSRRFQLPLLMTTILLLVATSLMNDNHDIRVLPQAQNLPIADPRTHFTNWCAHIKSYDPNSTQHPVYIVAAEGGGIRAAYWTATVLGELNRKDTNFASHVFAISGVSGGSLGATVFTGLIAQSAARVKKTSHEILSHDFLAPTVAYMLYPDLVQRFLPFPCPSLCRAKALEMSWEDGWTSVTGNKFFGGPFGAIWTTKSNAPSLFLNGTCVETGHRIIASNLDPTEFNNCIDANDKVPAAYSISTAVDMSARFTYVSPAGRFQDGDHVVDGGYFENSGTATAAEIWKSISGGAPTVTIGKHTYFPVYIIINSTGDPPKKSALLSEVFAPIRTLLNTRVARAKYSQDTLPLDACHCFTLDLEEAPLPLGWQLSHAAMQEMNGQIVGLDGQVQNVVDELQKD